LLILRKAINKSRPDFVISFLVRTNIRTLLATIGTPFPVIISEQTDPIRGKPGRIWLWLRRWVYPLADHVIAHTQQAADFLRDSLHCKVTVIPNPVPLTPPREVAFRPSPVKVAAVGRLVFEKGFDLLLRAFAQVAQLYPNVTLNIFGEGNQRQKLETLRSELGLNNRVFLPGQVKDVFGVLQEADLFVMPSRMEGFGNVLCEAMACGLPVIASDCMGPRETVRHGVDGVLVPRGNVAMLVKAMSELLNDSHKRQLLAAQAREVMQRVNLKEVMNRWDAVLRNVSKKG
jgi:glycosyltransferase involved in cell wall biosynthesis